MESVGKFEFSRKDLIGHGAFAVVFKGRHKENRDCGVAVKCINKKNLAKSQSLLGKEIKILKDLKHENIVSLLDYQEIGGCVYLVMEYCNGGDLAEYLHSKGTLSEDTIRVFLQQIAQAMKVLHSKGILHRDLKPQNILLCHPEGRKSTSTNTYIKIADFGFARHLKTNTMAATLCGSPMYMAPEVIMSQSYDAKADLWSIGTIVYQCLTGKAPFHASTPQELRLFYENHRTVLPSIPKETSSQLRHLLLGLLQRNPKDRMNFDEFFHHPFLETCLSSRKGSPAPMFSYPSSGSASSSSSSSTSHLASSQHSEAEIQQLHPKVELSPAKNTVDFLQKDPSPQESHNASSYTEDYVMVPTQSPNEYACEEDVVSPIESCLIYTGSSPVAEQCSSPVEKTPVPSPLSQSPSKPVIKPEALVGRTSSHTVPIPVPTQIKNYHRMEQNLHPVGLQGSARVAPRYARNNRRCYLPCVGSKAVGPAINLRLPAGGALPHQFSPLLGTTPETSEQSLPLCTRTDLNNSPDIQDASSPKKMLDRIMTVPDLPAGGQTQFVQQTANLRGPFKRTFSTSRLSDMLLRAAFEAEEENDESLYCERGMDITAPPAGYIAGSPDMDSPPLAIFTIGSPSRGNSPADTFPPRIFSGSPSYMNSPWLLGGHPLQRGRRNSESEATQPLNIRPVHRGNRRCSETEATWMLNNRPLQRIHCRGSEAEATWMLNNMPFQRGSRRNSETEAMDATPHSSFVFHPPVLAEETLMEEAHTHTLNDLRFTSAFVQCVMELASSKGPGLDTISSPDVSFLEQSLVADQISLLSKDWSYAEQLVLYMKAEEFLSSALRTAKEDIKQGRLHPSATVKQVIRKLNELYKSCVTCCRSLNNQLQTFLLDKQKLMEHFNGLTAEKLIYSHTVHMVRSAALDEMFHYSTATVQRYNKALLLMEGLSRTMTEQSDIDSINKCKRRIEQRLSTLET